MAKRTTKPTWAFERTFLNKGSLVGIRTRLRNIAQCDSTLPDEHAKLHSATVMIGQVLSNWDDPKRKDASQKRFKELERRKTK